MLMVDLLGWWYFRGWLWFMRHMFVEQTGKIMQFFSISDLLKTLFSPFRQDAVNVKGAPIGVRLQIFGGNIISRFFGFIIRTTLIFVGLILVLLNGIFAVVASLVWPLMPISPVVAVVLIVAGVGV
jgi:hypothetical protein